MSDQDPRMYVTDDGGVRRFNGRTAEERLAALDARSDVCIDSTSLVIATRVSRLLSMLRPLFDLAMRNALLGCTAACLVACGGTYPEPKEAEASTAAAVRSAGEVGAERDPKATLHLKYAKDQSEQATHLIANGDNQRAEMVLERARADAELALMLARAHNEEQEAEKSEAEVVEKRRKLGK